MITTEHWYIPEMSSEMQDCLFPNLGIVRNMKSTDFFFIYSIPGEAYRLRHIDRKTGICFFCFQQYIYLKYQPTQSLIYLFVCYQFDIYFYVGSIDEESTEDMEKKKL